jgi:hypothetical protein
MDSTTAVAIAAVQTREQTEIQAALLSAKHYPRDEARCCDVALKAMTRPSMAEAAAYAFPRGGQTVTGPSVELARELARIWGNIRHGLRIVGADEETIHLQGFAIDLESNARVEHEDKFAKKIQRKDKKTGVTQWIAPDERDLRELVNRRGAILVRNAILQLLPADLIDDCLRAAQETKAKVMRAGNKPEQIGRMVSAFEKLGASKGQLEIYLGRPVAEMTDVEFADLSAVYKSIRDGAASVADYFVTPGQAKQISGAVELNARLADERNAVSSTEEVNL